MQTFAFQKEDSVDQKDDLRSESQQQEDSVDQKDDLRSESQQQEDSVDQKDDLKSESQQQLSAQIHRTLFDREYIERELNNHHEENKDLVLEDEIDSTDLGSGIELQWKSYKN